MDPYQRVVLELRPQSHGATPFDVTAIHVGLSNRGVYDRTFCKNNKECTRKDFSRTLIID